MAQFPIESGDSAAIAEGLNYLLSGPAGLGQNFQGFSAYAPAYIRPAGRQPWSLPVTTGLNPSIYLSIPLSSAAPVGGNPSQYVSFTFATPQATAPFQFGDSLEVAGIVDDASGESYNYPTYLVYSSTTTEVTVITAETYTWSVYVSGGTVGRNFLNYETDTDCNARVSVAGPTDQVFVSAQLDLSWEYESVVPTDYDVVVSIYRLQGYPNDAPGNNDYLFYGAVLVSEKTFAQPAASGIGTSSLEAVFTTVLDGPNLDFGYYWYILAVQFNVPGGIPIEADSRNFVVTGTRDPAGAGLTWGPIFPTTVTGFGTGLEVSVTLYDVNPDTYNLITNTTIAVTATGTGYRIGDQLTILGTDLGGASPANDMTLVVTYSAEPFDLTIGRATMGLRSLTAQVIKQ
jgi:hypothetical protein